MAADLQTLVNAIPSAQDGSVIDSRYHNTLKAAVEGIVGQLDTGGGSQNVTESYPPHFLQNSSGPNWMQLNGVATPTGTPGNANGWFALQLPNRARIQSMTVAGRRAGPVLPFNVQLMRVTIADSNNVTLIPLILGTAPDPFMITGTVQVPGAGTAALEEYRTVDNNLYTYLIIANVHNATDIIQINGFRVVYTPP
jgi:hypothetical protein